MSKKSKFETSSALHEGTVDSLIDLGFVSMTLWSAVEAHGVHRDMGHLFGGNLHLEHNKRNTMRQREDMYQEETQHTERQNTFIKVFVESPSRFKQ